MRYLGIDYGTKKIGVAVSDDAGSFAFPRGTLDNDDKILDTFAAFVEKERIEEIVMGDTRTDLGEENRITKESDKFAYELEAWLKLPMHRVREAWSTQEAARYAPQGQKHDDSAAAAIILQRFLDTQQNK
jgi:putative Holliday junction resolvase